MTWDFYTKPGSQLPPIPARNTLATLDPISWRYKYWYDYRGPKETYPATYLTPRVNQYSLDGGSTSASTSYYNPGWYNPGHWQCGDQCCPLCYPSSGAGVGVGVTAGADPKNRLTDYWRNYLAGSNMNEATYGRWWSQHWPHFYGYGYGNSGNYWQYPKTA